MDKMTDWSINLPAWAYQLGYRLRGMCGTYDSLHLLKYSEIIKTFEYDKIPNLAEIEEIIIKEMDALHRYGRKKESLDEGSS